MRLSTSVGRLFIVEHPVHCGSSVLVITPPLSAPAQNDFCIYTVERWPLISSIHVVSMNTMLSDAYSILTLCVSAFSIYDVFVRLPTSVGRLFIVEHTVHCGSWVLSKLAAASHLLDHYQSKSLVVAMTSFPCLPPLMPFLLEPPSVQLELPLLLVVVMPPCPLFLLRCDWNPNVGALPRDWEGKTF